MGSMRSWFIIWDIHIWHNVTFNSQVDTGWIQSSIPGRCQKTSLTKIAVRLLLFICLWIDLKARHRLATNLEESEN